MRKIKNIVSVFTKVTTGALLSFAVFNTWAFPCRNVPTAELWQILAGSFLCSCTMLIFPENKILGKKEMIVRTLLQCLSVNLIIMGIGYFGNWYRFSDLGRILFLLLSINLIYLIIFWIFWKKNEGEAEEMDQKLKKYQGKK